MYEDTAYKQDSLKQLLYRLDDIHKNITKAVGRISRWQASAERTGGSIVTMRTDDGYRESRTERAILEADAEKWGINELKAERDELIAIIAPYIRQLPAGLVRAVANLRFLEGLPCIAIAKTLHYSRCHIYRLLDTAMTMMCTAETEGGSRAAM